MEEPAKILVFGPLAAAAAAAGGGLSDAQQFFVALGNSDYWSDVDELRLGRSLDQWLPPVLLQALAAAAEQAAGRPLGRGGDSPGGDGAEDGTVERALAGWLATTTAAIHAGGDGLTFKELEYFIVSGANRAAALIKVIDSVVPGRPLPRVTDVGAGVGLIPLLLAAEPRLGLRTVALVEPSERYVSGGQALWSLAAGPDLGFEYQQSPAESGRLSKGQDLVFFGQCFFRIEHGRRTDVVARVREALAPGGCLIVNEIVRSDPAAPEPEWDQRYPACIPAPELVEILSGCGQVALLRRASRWQEREAPGPLKASEIGADSFFVVIR